MITNVIVMISNTVENKKRRVHDSSFLFIPLPHLILDYVRQVEWRCEVIRQLLEEGQRLADVCEKLSRPCVRFVPILVRHLNLDRVERQLVARHLVRLTHYQRVAVERSVRLFYLSFHDRISYYRFAHNNLPIT